MKKIAFISNFPAPYIEKFVVEMNKYSDFRGFFYERMGEERPSYWKIPLSDKTTILKDTLFTKSRSYISFSLIYNLIRFKPDIVIIGGIGIPSNYFAYLYAKLFNKKIILFSEYKRNSSGKAIEFGFKIKLLLKLYGKGFDCVFAVGEHGFRYFKDIFPHSKVVSVTYPVDLAGCSNNSPAVMDGKYIRLMFPHRVNRNYGAHNLFGIVTKLLDIGYCPQVFVPSYGEEYLKFRRDVTLNNLESYFVFMDDFTSWDEISSSYDQLHFSVSPCLFSNGNMSILEVMASGVVPIMSDAVKFNSDLVQSKGGGIVCSISCFVENIVRYYESPELYAELSGQARIASQPFSIYQVAINWKDLLEDIK